VTRHARRVTGARGRARFLDVALRAQARDERRTLRVRLVTVAALRGRVMRFFVTRLARDGVAARR